jgi:phosphatidylserine decarboxylase
LPGEFSVSFLQTDQLNQGERFGLIRFGSRVDIYMPLDVEEKCKVGDKVVAGESILAALK